MIDQEDSKLIRVCIADLAVGIFVDDARARESIVARYNQFLSPASNDIDIYLDLLPDQYNNYLMSPKIWSTSEIIFVEQAEFSGTINLQQKIGKMTTGRQRFLESLDYFLRVIFGVLAAAKGGIIFHCAAVVRESDGYVFFGVSGSGKTTVASLSGENAVLNDDLNYLRKEAGRWVAHATPFWNPTQTKPIPGDATITGLYRLVHDRNVFTKPIPITHATAEIIANTPVVSLIPELGRKLLTIAKDLATSVPCFELHFQRNDSFWDVIAKTGLN